MAQLPCQSLLLEPIQQASFLLSDCMLADLQRPFSDRIPDWETEGMCFDMLLPAMSFHGSNLHFILEITAADSVKDASTSFEENRGMYLNESIIEFSISSDQSYGTLVISVLHRKFCKRIHTQDLDETELRELSHINYGGYPDVGMEKVKQSCFRINSSLMKFICTAVFYRRLQVAIWSLNPPRTGAFSALKVAALYVQL